MSDYCEDCGHWPPGNINDLEAGWCEKARRHAGKDGCAPACCEFERKKRTCGETARELLAEAEMHPYEQNLWEVPCGWFTPPPRIKGLYLSWGRVLSDKEVAALNDFFKGEA